LPHIIIIFPVVISTHPTKETWGSNRFAGDDHSERLIEEDGNPIYPTTVAFAKIDHHHVRIRITMTGEFDHQGS
jgi:hypothetical protein